MVEGVPLKHRGPKTSSGTEKCLAAEKMQSTEMLLLEEAIQATIVKHKKMQRMQLLTRCIPLMDRGPKSSSGTEKRVSSLS